MSGLVGRRLGRYEVVSLLGTGGMGEVYRARDTELERDVAVKVLPDAASGDPAWLERFRREARALSRLSHPNILEIFDAGSDDGIRYVVTELLEGRTLRDHLEHGRLQIRKAVAIADAIARGLGAAHAQGVVHRDVKPENVMLTSDGRVKVLDFGIASLHEPEPAAIDVTEAQTVTSAGTLLGTIGYMAPEQVRGETADARSDVFAVGCVLYEMLTGRRAFERATPAATLAAIMHEEPAPPGALVPDLPASLARVVMRCLEKEPGERFQSAADIAFALRAAEGSRGHQTIARRGRRFDRRFVAAAILGAAVVVAAGLAWRHVAFGQSPLPEEKHLAVLDFTTNSDDPQLQQLAEGLTTTTADGLVPVLAQSRGVLWSVPRQSMTTEERKSIEALRRKYAINLAVTGRVERNGDRLGLRLAIVDAQNLRGLRESSIEDDLDNLGSFQQEPILSVARMMGVAVEPVTLQRLEARTTNHTVAFSSFLRAIGLMSSTLDASGADTAESLLREAVAADPRFSPAREALASLCLDRYRATNDSGWIDKGLESIDEVMKRSPTDPAFQIEAQLHAALGDHETAVRVLAEAVRRYPTEGFLHLAIGREYRASNQLPAAERSFERAVNLLPGYWPALYWLGMLNYERGRYDAAANSWRAVVHCAPEYDGGYTNLGLAYYMLDRHDDAGQMFERALELTGGTDYVALSNLGTLYFEESRFGEAASLFERALRIYDGHHAVWGNLGQTYAATRNPERAEAPFRRAIALAEADLTDQPEDPDLLAALASYHAMLGDKAIANRYLESVIRLGPTEPTLMAVIGETFEDIGMRDKALDWVRRALAEGVPASRFESRPGMRGFIDDPRFQNMVAEMLEPRSPQREGATP